MSSLTVFKAGSRKSIRASADYFTGTVWQEPIADAPEPGRVRAIRVTFEPGARTNWHTHPLGQTLQVVTGLCWVQAEGEPKLEVAPGDTVWIPPQVKHWHGATDTVAMVHLAIQEAVDGATATWLEPVSEADYLAG